jgi:hypothetical protein
MSLRRSPAYDPVQIFDSTVRSFRMRRLLNGMQAHAIERLPARLEWLCIRKQCQQAYKPPRARWTAFVTVQLRGAA